MKEFYVKIVVMVPDKFPEEPETVGFWDDLANDIIDAQVARFKARDGTLTDDEIQLHIHYADQPIDETEAERKVRLGL